MSKNYVAYKGPEFTIEWYYSERDESQALNYYLELDDGDRKVKEGTYYETSETDKKTTTRGKGSKNKR
jgi:hypothetical protein